MMMCKADVTGSMTPTVAKHTQSVEPVVGTIQQDVRRHVCGCQSNTPDSWQRSPSLPAGMMPMCSGHGCKTTSGSFSQRSASCCVRPTTPWSTSLNMPSPPTHTTLSFGQAEASLSVFLHRVHLRCQRRREASPVKAGQVFLQEVISGLVRPFRHYTKQHRARRSDSNPVGLSTLEFLRHSPIT